MNEEMTFADACLVLREWKKISDDDQLTKKQVTDFVTAVILVFTYRR